MGMGIEIVGMDIDDDEYDDRDDDRDPDCGEDGDEEEIAVMYVLLPVVTVVGDDSDCLSSSDSCADTIHTLQ